MFYLWNTQRHFVGTVKVAWHNTATPSYRITLVLCSKLYQQKASISITISATPDENSSPRIPLASGAEVLGPRAKVSEMANAMLEAKAVNGKYSAAPVTSHA